MKRALLVGAVLALAAIGSPALAAPAVDVSIAIEHQAPELAADVRVAPATDTEALRFEALGGSDELVAVTPPASSGFTLRAVYTVLVDDGPALPADFHLRL